MAHIRRLGILVYRVLGDLEFALREKVCISNMLSKSNRVILLTSSCRYQKYYVMSYFSGWPGATNEYSPNNEYNYNITAH